MTGTLLGPIACNVPVDTAQNEILLQADRDFAALADKQGAQAAFAAYFADDAQEFGADSPPVVGGRTIAARQSGLGKNRLAWIPRSAQVARDGSLGWTWGEWKIMAPTDSAIPLQRGKYLDVWRREPDGSWKVVADIGNVANEESTH